MGRLAGEAHGRSRVRGRAFIWFLHYSPTLNYFADLIEGMWRRGESTKRGCPSAIGGRPKTILSEYRRRDTRLSRTTYTLPWHQVTAGYLTPVSSRASHIVTHILLHLFVLFSFQILNSVRVDNEWRRAMNRSQDLEGAVDLGKVSSRGVHSCREAALYSRHNGTVLLTSSYLI